MKLLFIENRYATQLNEAVARSLIDAGHEVHWAVQNPLFTPSLGTSHSLRFPTSEDLGPSGPEPIFEKLRRSDRGVLHFGIPPTHHKHYHREIAAVFDRVRPDVVFGESTQMHELLAIDAARSRDIPYLFPTATRYPPSRMSFLAYDSMVPVGGSGEELSDQQAADLISAINNRTLIPSYMTGSPATRSERVLRQIKDRLLITWGWIKGERYITPSPLHKFKIDRAQDVLRKRWDTLAGDSLPRTGRPYVLYAMQMQPESTIDVWGLPWNDQAAIITRAASALNAVGYDLVVKPNPKSKYEITEGLCRAAESTDNIIPIRHGVPMQGLFNGASAILSVTGTVLIEAVLSGKTALSLGDHAMAHYAGVKALSAPEQVVEHLGHVSTGPVPAGVSLIQELNRSSYPAEVVDPITQQERVTPEAIDRLSAAFHQVLAHVASRTPASISSS